MKRIFLPFLFLLFALAVQAQPSTNLVRRGLNANKGSTCTPGSIYTATDTGHMFLCPAGTWVDFGAGGSSGITNSAGNNVITKSDGTNIVASGLTDNGTTITSAETLALGTNNLTMTGSLGATGARLTKGWFTDLQVTNAIAGSVTGNAATVTTNANLTGPITSSGNTTAIASQTGTGTKFVVDTSPSLIGTVGISGATTTGPDVEVSITGDTQARVALGINTSDIARVSLGPGNAVRDLFIERSAGATVRWGAPDAAAPVAQIDTVQGVVAGTSNTAGANRTYKGSAGTGTGIGGSHIFQVAPAGSTGTSQNAFADVLTLDSTKKATFTGIVSLANSVAAAPNLTWSISATTGFYTSTATALGFSSGGTASVGFGASGVVVKATGLYTFSSTADPFAAPDTGLARNGAGVVEFNNGTAGTFRDWTARASTLSSATAPITFSNAAYQSCTALTTTAGGVLQCTVSDERFKLGFKSFPNALEVIRNIHPRSFEWKPDTQYADGRRHLGFIAQDLDKANPLLASKTGAGIWQPDQLAIQALTVQSVQELDKKIADLTKLVNQQQKEIERLRRK